MRKSAHGGVFVRRLFTVVLVIGIILSLSPIPTAKAEATLNADAIGQPVYIAFVKVAPDGSRTAYYTVWAPLTATGVWEGAGVSINVDTATYTADACGSGTAVVDTYDNVKVFTMCTIPEGTIPSPTDQLTISWTWGGSNVSTTLDIAFWWFLSPEGETPTPSGEYYFDFANYGYNADGMGIMVFPTSLPYSYRTYVYVYIADATDQFVFDTTIRYYPYGPVVFAVGNGEIDLYDYNGLKKFTWHVPSPSADGQEVHPHAFSLINSEYPVDTFPQLNYATLHWSVVDYTKEPELYTGEEQTITSGESLSIQVETYTDENGESDSGFEISGYPRHLAWISPDEMSTTPPWNVTVYQPTSSDWTGIADTLGVTSSTTQSTTITTDTSSWSSFLCDLINVGVQIFHFLALPWQIVSGLFSSVSSWLTAGRDYIFSLLGSIASLPSPVDILVGFSIAIALLYASLNIADWVIAVIRLGLETVSAAPKVAVAVVIAVAISAIAGALGASLSQSYTVCNFGITVQTDGASTGSSIVDEGAGAGGGETGW